MKLPRTLYFSGLSYEILKILCSCNSRFNQSENSNDNDIHCIVSDSNGEDELLQNVPDITTETVNTLTEMENEIYENVIEDSLITPLNSIFIVSDHQTKTISLTEYKELIQLIPQTEKLKNTIRVMENVIRKKDRLLREMNKTQQSLLKNVNHSSSLSAVCDIRKLFRISIYRSIFRPKQIMHINSKL